MRQAITRTSEVFFSMSLLQTLSEIWEIFLLKQIYFILYTTVYRCIVKRYTRLAQATLYTKPEELIW